MVTIRYCIGFIPCTPSYYRNVCGKLVCILVKPILVRLRFWQVHFCICVHHGRLGLWHEKLFLLWR